MWNTTLCELKKPFNPHHIWGFVLIMFIFTFHLAILLTVWALVLYFSTHFLLVLVFTQGGNIFRKRWRNQQLITVLSVLVFCCTHCRQNVRVKSLVLTLNTRKCSTKGLSKTSSHIFWGNDPLTLIKINQAVQEPVQSTAAVSLGFSQTITESSN